MINVGEQLVSSYLHHILGCEFIQTNLPIPDAQGEIDVVGVNLTEKRVYICEVAIHLTTGLQYTKNSGPNNIEKLTTKFSKDIDYAHAHLNEYDPTFMLWSPVVKNSKGQVKYNQAQHIRAIRQNIRERYRVNIEWIINERFQECLHELRAFVKTQTKALQCPLLRLMQVEEHLSTFLNKGQIR